MSCDVCGFEGETLVACSALGPVSFSYCAGCVHENAEPLFMLEATFEMCGEHVAEHVRKVKTVTEAGPMTWGQFVDHKKER